MSEQVETSRDYWVAIRPAITSSINVFGPYTMAEATANRAQWLLDYPTTAMISAVFQANSRHRANQMVHAYMPPVDY